MAARLSNEHVSKPREKKDRMANSILHIALAGNPNCGKTTLFNLITGANGYVGNWPGVTVEKKEAPLSRDKGVLITDLPGIYSLSPYSPEERVSRDYLMGGEPDVVINVGVSGPGVVKKALDRAFEAKGDYLTITDAAEVIKHTAYKVTRVGEIIGNEVAQRLNLPFGVADLSLAPTPAVGDSVGEIFQTMGLSSIGAPGTTAILAMLNDAVKKGGVFASSHVGGLSGAFIPVSEDSAIEAAARSGALTMEKLEAMTSVCSVGLDMIAIPGDTSAATISGMIADEMAIGMINSKTTAVRIIPVPGKGVGEKAVFGGLLGEAAIIRVPGGDSTGFVKLGGRIPAPIHSLKN